MRLLLNQAATVVTTHVVITVTVAPTAVPTVIVAATTATGTTTRAVITMTVAPTTVPWVIVVGESGCSLGSKRAVRKHTYAHPLRIRFVGYVVIMRYLHNPHC
jgi:hypothetical protein